MPEQHMTALPVHRMALQLSSNVTDELVGQLAPLVNLRELSLRGCTSLTGGHDSGFAQLTALSRLQSLDLTNCDSLRARFFHVTALNCCLKAAIFSRTWLRLSWQGDAQMPHAAQDDAMEVVSRLGVRQLRMVGCPQLTDAALGRLAAMPALTHLDIGCNVHFSDHGVASLAAAAGVVLCTCACRLCYSMHIRSPASS